ncbi:MAG: metallophosphoesterase [Firmicutes bacterium]|mgnify:FL=1|nr:metallophosphoesterase [Bacillota bacterium]
MKFLIVGDTVDPQLYDHFRRDRFPESISAILSVGDLPAWYLSYLMSVFNAPLYYVRGNHDYSFDTNPPEGGENIHGKVVAFKGLTIIGFEGSMFYHHPQAVQYTEREMWWTWAKMRWRFWFGRRIDIVLTHAPPFGIHDADDQCHKGFLTFSRLIHKYRPRYFIHGHTHLNYGLKQKRIDIVNDTTVINGYGFYILDVQ